MTLDRRVVIDDTDPNIKYTGPWLLHTSGIQDGVGSRGPPYLRTLHGVTSGSAAAEFEFNGTEITVWGSLNVNTTTNVSQFFQCFIDDVQVNVPKMTLASGNNIIFCGDFGLSSTLHTLRVEVGAMPTGQQMWLDRLCYTPSPGLPLDNKTIEVANTDPAVRFTSSTGKPLVETTRLTEKNSTAQVSFTGTSICWVGSPFNTTGQAEATASWRIDNGEPIQFLVPVLTPSPGHKVEYNQIYFSTPDFEPGLHALTVTFLGDDTTTALSLEYLLVKKGSLPLLTSTDDNNANHGGSLSGKNTHTVLGGALGGVAFFIVVMSTIVFCWRLRLKSRRREGHNIVDGPRAYIPISFNLSHNTTNPTLHIRKPPLHPTRCNVAALEPTPAPLFPNSRDEQPSATRKQRGTVTGGSVILLNNNLDEVRQVERSIELLPPLSPPPPPSPLQLAPTQEAVAAGANEVIHQHQDSGLRLSALTVVEVPPEYTSF